MWENPKAWQTALGPAVQWRSFLRAVDLKKCPAPYCWYKFTSSFTTLVALVASELARSVPYAVCILMHVSCLSPFHVMVCHRQVKQKKLSHVKAAGGTKRSLLIALVLRHSAQDRATRGRMKTCGNRTCGGSANGVTSWELGPFGDRLVEPVWA